jgi:lipopolysaccharide/colanic/teichoic acid biosynthesis glycosyltransferase
MRSRSAQASSVTPEVGLSRRQRAAKRTLDVVVAGVGAAVTSPLMAAGFVVATVDTREWGIFTQVRVGRNGRPIRVHKLRTMRSSTTHTTTVTTIDDPRITRIGRQLRRFKIDELPQLVDVLVGSMSLVGPRPDVTGWADRLQGRDQVILSVRPGITGPATLAFRNEEAVLSRVDDPEQHNRDVIWPEKVRLNRNYVEDWSLKSDIRLLVKTVVSVTSYQAGSSGQRQAAL